MSWDKETHHEYIWPSIEGPNGPHSFVIHQIKAPVYTWCFKLEPHGDPLFNCQKGPNWFHRFMQRWLLGIYWMRLP